MRRILNSIGCLFAALFLVAAPANAFGLWPAADHELGPISWTGFIIDPDVGYQSFDVGGSGGVQFNDAEGWHLGGELGYDYQMGSIVVGAVTNGSLAWIDEDAGENEIEISAFGTIRARLGFAAHRFLFFGTGGVAFASAEVSTAAGSDEATFTGWAAGGGLEYLWNSKTAVRFEYLRMEFDSERFSSLTAPANEIDLDAHVFSLGFVHRF